jgi:DNA-3-methyladenine glycosylase
MKAPRGRRLRRAFFENEVEVLAPALLGISIIVNGVGGVIVETEAYDSGDPAAYSFRGPTKHNAVLFGAPGQAHVHKIYGLHWSLNFVAGIPGSAVLIRAIEPLWGLETMAVRRGVSVPRVLCSGPGRLCQALAIDGALNGTSFDKTPFRLYERSEEPSIVVGPRVGITKNVDKPWRFGVASSRFLSKPFPPG